MPAPVRTADSAPVNAVPIVATRDAAPRSARVERVIVAPAAIALPPAPILARPAKLLASAASVPLFKAHCSFLL